MTIHELYIACGNFNNDTFCRVFPNVIEECDTLFCGRYGEIPKTIDEMPIECFKFDKDMDRVLIIVNS